MATQNASGNSFIMLSVVGAAAWLIPGGGYFVLGDDRRAWVVLVTIALTFVTGLYIGSIGVIDPVASKPWYVAQMMNSPAVLLIGNHVAQAQYAAQRAIGSAGSNPAARKQAIQNVERTVYRVYAKPNEIGQIFTSIAGLLNLLCIVNAMYMMHVRQNAAPGG